ncbi:glutathione peroxidase [Stylonychia lemnae]|uniref:Glutathione peroxidase n=1 Tax=Stylonychia lemnae TaxID=5949 RepID=A0A078B150_STYLE|nr:glutathione peroxidase [Stylonychia lemnae]|eukprot:CDW86833.1 glutathione peroxidase [Stylonychia lemnae]
MKKAAKIPSPYKSLWDIPIKDLKGTEYPTFQDYFKTQNPPKPIPKFAMVINVASKCGLTRGHYTQLVELHNQFRNRGFEVLGFPCNQFLFQEPGSPEDIEKFACEIYKAEFPLFEKCKVNGEDAHEVFKFLKEKANLNRIEWNFGKFLVDQNGQLIKYVGSRTEPNTIKGELEELINAKTL